MVEVDLEDGHSDGVVPRPSGSSRDSWTFEVEKLAASRIISDSQPADLTQTTP